MRKFILTTVFSLSIVLATAEVSPSYYASLEGKSGDELFQATHDLIVDHTQLSYFNAWAYRTGIWTVDGKILDMYSGCSFVVNDHCGSGEFGECECYNREHAVPKSFWGCKSTSDESEPMISDLVHVIPADYLANYKRSAWIYDEVSSASWTNDAGAKLGNSQAYSSETAFEPPTEFKGDLARIYFYMLVCYSDKNFTQGGKGYRMFTYSNNKADFQPYLKTLLLKWHRNDDVANVEVNRNDKIYDLQGNRNPFVDYPLLVEYIWGDRVGQPFYTTATDLRTAAHTELSITTTNGVIGVEANENELIRIFDSLGRLLYSASSACEFTPDVAGLYVICAGDRSEKVIVTK